MAKTSPGRITALLRMMLSTERSMEPRCTGMCGALATSAAVRVEHRAGEIQPLLDVDRIGGVLQRHAHLLGDRHEEVVEDLQHHRIGARADARCAAGSGTARASTRWLRGVSSAAPAVLDDDGLVGLDDQRRAVHAMARARAARAMKTAASRHAPSEKKRVRRASAPAAARRRQAAPSRRARSRRRPLRPKSPRRRGLWSGR